MRKTYILDTSALLENPEVYKSFPDSDVVIPIGVINELDKKKLAIGEVGKNARVCIRALDQLSTDADISAGIQLDNDITLKIDAEDYSSNCKGFGNPEYVDTQILVCAYALMNGAKDNGDYSEGDVVLVSNDLNLRLKAKARGLSAVGNIEKKFSFNDLYSGEKAVICEDAGIELLNQGFIDPIDIDLELLPNECVSFEDEEGNCLSLGRMVKGKIKLIKTNPKEKIYPWGISSRNKEQTFAMDMLMDPNIDLVTLIGRAGTGKTLCALACALELVLSKKQYNKLIVYRPIQPVGNDIGYLPGTMSEKLEPWFSAIMDSFETLLSTKGGNWRDNLEMYKKKDKVNLEAITYIRGRSIPNAIIYCDEVQNISAQDIKTLLTRAGEGSKIILSGDIDQIDAEHLDVFSNGLTYVVEKFKQYELSAHMILNSGERSRLATLSSEIL